MDEDERSIHLLIIQYLVAHTQCSGCGQRYAPEDIHIRHRRGDIWLASVVCRHCGLQGLIMAAIRTSSAEEEGVPSIVEPDGEERAIFQEMGPISADEVLDFHRFLQRFSGDVQQLFRASGSA